MDAVSHKVGELSSPDRAALEHLVGRPLGLDDHVVVIDFREVETANAAREAARTQVRAIVERAAKNAAAAGMAAQEADEAIADVMASIRPRAVR